MKSKDELTVAEIKKWPVFFVSVGTTLIWLIIFQSKFFSNLIWLNVTYTTHYFGFYKLGWYLVALGFLGLFIFIWLLLWRFSESEVVKKITYYTKK